MTDPILLLTRPELRALLAFWRERAGGGDVPLAQDMEPADLRTWLDHLVVMDVVPRGGGYAYSYYGKSFAESFGENRIGQKLERLPPEQQALLQEEYERVRAGRVPVSRVYRADFDGVEQTWERLVLPLSTDGETVDKLLVAAYTAGSADVAAANPDAS